MARKPIRNARNFWLEGVVDGRTARIAFGPKWGADGFKLTVFQKHLGKSIKAATLIGTYNPRTGMCELAFHPVNGPGRYVSTVRDEDASARPVQSGIHERDVQELSLGSIMPDPSRLADYDGEDDETFPVQTREQQDAEQYDITWANTQSVNPDYPE